jgi:glucuronosyltransferase
MSRGAYWQSVNANSATEYWSKILGIFPFQRKSHFIVASALLRELANRGHDVTVISHYPQAEKIANYTDVYVKQHLWMS